MRKRPRRCAAWHEHRCAAWHEHRCAAWGGCRSAGEAHAVSGPPRDPLCLQYAGRSGFAYAAPAAAAVGRAERDRGGAHDHAEPDAADRPSRSFRQSGDLVVLRPAARVVRSGQRGRGRGAPGGLPRPGRYATLGAGADGGAGRRSRRLARGGVPLRQSAGSGPRRGRRLRQGVVSARAPGTSTRSAT